MSTTRRRHLWALATSPLGRSIWSLYAIQLASYLLPIVSFPYLVRVLGPSHFGLYVFVLAVARYGLLVTDWGFNYSATRDISTERARGASSSATYSAALASRVCLLAACAGALAVLTLGAPHFRHDIGLYWIAFIGVCGSALLPIWLYQAAERLPIVTGSLLGARVVTTALVFVLVHSAADVDRALALWSAPWMVAALVALLAARRLTGVRLLRVGVSSVRRALSDGSAIFLTLLLASLYTALNGIVLGLLTNNAQVGFYGAAETVILAGVGLVGPLAQALFPHAAQAGVGGTEDALRHVRRVLPVLGALGAALCIGVLVLAPVAGHLVFGARFDRSITILQIMSPIPLVVALATALSTQLMLPLRMDRAYSAIVGCGAVLSLVLTFVLVPRFEAIGTAITVTSTETTILLMLFLYLRRKGLHPVGRARPSPAPS